jgi:hypothetical protein
MTRNQLQNADRWELVVYLEYWGYQVYDHETTDELRAVALANHDTEEAGHALALENYTRGEK